MPGVTPELIDRAFFNDRAEVPPYEEQPWHVSPRHEARLAESMGWAMSVESLPDLDADRALARSLRAQRPDLSQLTDSALHARARSMVPYIQQTFENAMRVSTLSSLGPGALGANLRRTGRLRTLCAAAGRDRGRFGARRRMRCGSSAAPPVRRPPCPQPSAGPDQVLAALRPKTSTR